MLSLPLLTDNFVVYNNYLAQLRFYDPRIGGHLKNIRFATPGRLFFGTKKAQKFGSGNRKVPVLQFLKISELCQEKKLQQTPASSPKNNSSKHY